MNELEGQQRLHVQQVYEGLEIVLGWETRNKYRILDQNQNPILYAAEMKSSLGGALLRQIMGHWRAFKVQVFNQQKHHLLTLDFPFRWFFKTLIVKEVTGRRIGKLQQRFSLLYKKFDLFDAQGRIVGQIKSPFWKLWTFEVRDGDKKLGTIKKKWSGALGEFFTDKDNFVVSFAKADSDKDFKLLLLSACLMVDIVYFEDNQGKSGLGALFD